MLRLFIYSFVFRREVRFCINHLILLFVLFCFHKGEYFFHDRKMFRVFLTSCILLKKYIKIIPTIISPLNLITSMASQKPYLKIQLIHSLSKKITKRLHIKYLFSKCQRWRCFCVRSVFQHLKNSLNGLILIR